MENISLPIVEIFTSVQGEGAHMGRFVTFVRLAGCNLACPWCDTKESWNVNNVGRMTIPAIVHSVTTYQVVITGGEPTIHEDLANLVHALKKAGHYVSIETNGTNPVPREIDWVTVSPKEQNGFKIHPLLHVDELKYVVDDHFRLEVIPETIRAQYSGLIWLQPEGGQMQTSWQRCIKMAEQDERLRVGCQLHKLMEVR